MKKLKFTITHTNTITDWLRHCAFHKTANQGAIGGRLTYCFTPTNLGTIIKIKCACGEELDLTNYESW
jgi:hypothetical protein